MARTTINTFYVKGIAVRTTNENNAAAIAIPQLWNRFITENILQQITGRNSDDIYCVYTEYEKDFTRPYTTILGCRVKDDAPTQEGFIKVAIKDGPYEVFTAKGNLQEGAVYYEWLKIWSAAIHRTYLTDFEVYGSKAGNLANAEVDIFVSIA